MTFILQLVCIVCGRLHVCFMCGIYVGEGGIWEYVVCVVVGVWRCFRFPHLSFETNTFENTCNSYSLPTQSVISGLLK